VIFPFKFIIGIFQLEWPAKATAKKMQRCGKMGAFPRILEKILAVLFTAYFPGFATFHYTLIFSWLVVWNIFYCP
jgi:hypothetical protein